jgi:hypothetical protein
MLFAQCFCHQVEGPLDLAVGELVRAVAPVLGHARPRLVGPGQRGEYVVHPGQVRGLAAVQRQVHAQY